MPYYVQVDLATGQALRNSVWAPDDAAGLAAMRSDYAREVRPAPPYVPKYDPGYCKAAYGLWAPAADFTTGYAYKVPPAEFRAAISRLQRSGSVAPYCPYFGKVASLEWVKDGNVCRGKWRCNDCADKHRIPKHGLIFGPPANDDR